MPNIDSGGLPASRRRPRRRAHDLHARRPQGDAAGRAGLGLPLRHRLVVNDVRWAGVRIADVLEQRGREERVVALRFVSAEVPVRGLAHHPAGAAARRDARLRDGRQAALASPRRPCPARDAGDVRLQERQVGRTGSSSARRRGRLLGAARLRRGRLDRELQWLLPEPVPPEPTASSASPAPSACSTGRTPRRSSRCSRPG